MEVSSGGGGGGDGGGGGGDGGGGGGVRNTGKRRGGGDSCALRDTVGSENDTASPLALGIEGGRGAGMALRRWLLGKRALLLLLGPEFGKGTG